MSLRDDGAAALDWLAAYLESVRERPVLSRVQPGAIRDALPARAPETAEPFAAVLRDLDEVLMPGLTHWQHPSFFAFFPANIIKIGDGGAPESFVTVAGIRAKTISLNARAVDGTSGESPQAWRELIAGAGVKSASVSGAGVFKDAQSDAMLQQVFFAQAARSLSNGTIKGRRFRATIVR